MHENEFANKGERRNTRMTLTEKECGLLQDMKQQEQLCIEKYEKYARMACSTELKALFCDLRDIEKRHLASIEALQQGQVSMVGESIEGSNNRHCGCSDYCDEQSRAQDAFLCRDMLMTEKHASSLYDTSVFEFADPAARKLLSHIQQEEQQHGERLFAYMKANQIYG